jgi:hypothetical protein
MKQGWNPSRRNRNIGTSRQGYGKDNRHTIPKGFPDNQVFYENLIGAVAIPRTIGENELTFLVEPTRKGCFHACTVDDICHILEGIPQEFLLYLDLIILRQPTRRQTILHRAWGIHFYYAGPGRYSGTTICLEAQDLSKPLRWGISLSPEEQKDLKRLEVDGHRITRTKRFYEIEMSEESIRNTQLYGTLLHELGHHVDWLINTAIPILNGVDPKEEDHIISAFHSKPTRDKEVFANEWADGMKTLLASKNVIPFERILNHNQMERERLKANWFVMPDA